MRILSALVLLVPSLASAHVSLTSGPAQANKSQLVTFGVGHGCTDTAGKHLDTVKVTVQIPAGVTGVRGLRSDFGNPSYTKDGAGLVTAITWTKPASDLLDADDSYYEVKLRGKVPDAPFTKLQWNVIQVCEDSTTHAQITVPWDQPEGSTTGEPAAIQMVVPARTNGWNKFTMSRALTIEEVAAYLGDAQIVWKGNAAYSSNANTTAQIAATAGVTALASVAANDELWVRY